MDDMYKEDLDSSNLINYELTSGQDILYQN